MNINAENAIQYFLFYKNLVLQKRTLPVPNAAPQTLKNYYQHFHVQLQKEMFFLHQPRTEVTAAAEEFLPAEP